MKKGYFFLFIAVVIGISLFFVFTQRSEAQKSSGPLIVVSPGSTQSEPTVFILNTSTGILCAYQLQGGFLRFVAKRSIGGDFFVRDFHTR